MRVTSYIPEDAAREDWDVVVVGTGMGGSTLGYELARRGRRVLFVEKGRFLHGDPRLNAAPAGGCRESEARLRVGRWPERIQGWTSFGPVEFFAPLGCGTGGSTTLYGAQLERFTPGDLQPRAQFPEVQEANLPERWPISYEELLPFYRRAEEHYSVCGTQDALNPDGQARLRTPPPLSERDQLIHDAFTAQGLHPYRSHVGYHQLQDCWECIDLCPRRCKGDAGSRSLLPALQRHGASLLPECEVLELLAERRRVTAIRARQGGRELRIRARVFVLACGALSTPALLLRSRSADWPEGLANSSGAVGRNLMLHTSDFLLIDPREERSAAGPVKSLSLNDFYCGERGKLGTLQSVGLRPQAPFILAYLRYLEEKDPRWWRRPLSRHLPRLAELAGRRFRRGSVFSTIVEDLPYADNRVLLDPGVPGGFRFVYAYSGELRRRNQLFRRELRRRLAPRLRLRVVTGGTNNINYGHACGTCRFGEDPATSVLDRDNRAHDLDNLYVSDGSFFPSSGGTNPSLTIAANALRVAGIIAGTLGGSAEPGGK
ncbi:MAG TPA: GMC family oxidoreductase [Polyangiaceae bacterium]|nr:GMC family oxidoreductase [Polyangiaceae bacterium]